jgi:23S rRNA (cytosine1962-C5)-methyltransferase
MPPAPADLAKITLKPGHVQPVWAGHPWVFAQAVARIDGEPAAGDEVLVCDAKQGVLGRGLYSPGSAILVRLFTRGADQAVDAALFERRIRMAIERRAAQGLPDPHTTGLRCIHAEGDGLPGLIVDRLGDALAVQWGTIGLKRREAWIMDLLERAYQPRAIVDRTSTRTAEQEGFVAGAGVQRGDPALSAFRFSERGLRYQVPLALAQKTGFYFDQRPLRARVEELSQGRRVLDTYCYVGSVALSAARGGASDVVAVDTSGLALSVAKETALDNGLDAKVRWVQGDALVELGRARAEFDLVVCDPPKLAPTRAARVRAGGAMRRLAAAASSAVREGGLIVLSSCSAALGPAELARALALGARDVGREALVLERLFQGADHPVPAAFPEGLYLSSIIAESRAI